MRLLDGEKMAPLCREFDISRKTGYKIFERYKDRSRRPYRHANQLPFQIEKQIVELKKERPTWGAPKIREKLRRLYRGSSRHLTFRSKSVTYVSEIICNPCPRYGPE